MSWDNPVWSDFLIQRGLLPLNMPTSKSSGVSGSNQPPIDPVSSAGVLGNYDDQSSWENYLQLINLSNSFNSAEAQKSRDWSEYMRDTQVQSYMNQLKDAGINPILAVSGGFNGDGYSSSAVASAYSGTSPYSNSSRVDAAIIRALGSAFSSILNAAGKFS